MTTDIIKNIGDKSIKAISETIMSNVDFNSKYHINFLTSKTVIALYTNIFKYFSVVLISKMKSTKDSLLIFLIN